MRRVLAAVAVALAVLLAGECWYVAGDGPVASAERPVVLGDQASRAATAEAARQVSAILSYGFEDFDAQLADAAARMTPSYAAEFEREVAADRERFEKGRITQEARVVDAGVVTADENRVESLVFLDQYVARAGAGTTVVPRRVLVTTVRTDGGWLVDAIRLV